MLFQARLYLSLPELNTYARAIQQGKITPETPDFLYENCTQLRKVAYFTVGCTKIDAEGNVFIVINDKLNGFSDVVFKGGNNTDSPLIGKEMMKNWYEWNIGKEFYF